MVKNQVLLGISHMRQDALDETFELLNELDPEAKVPVLATHMGVRFRGAHAVLDQAHSTARELGLLVVEARAAAPLSAWSLT